MFQCTDRHAWPGSLRLGLGMVTGDARSRPAIRRASGYDKARMGNASTSTTPSNWALLGFSLLRTDHTLQAAGVSCGAVPGAKNPGSVCLGSGGMRRVWAYLSALRNGSGLSGWSMVTRTSGLGLLATACTVTARRDSSLVWVGVTSVCGCMGKIRLPAHIGLCWRKFRRGTVYDHAHQRVRPVSGTVASRGENRLVRVVGYVLVYEQDTPLSGSLRYGSCRRNRAAGGTSI
jgi:hypothetical protein